MTVACACEARLASAPKHQGPNSQIDIDIDASLDESVDGRIEIISPDATVFGPWGPAIKIPGASTTGEEDDGGLSSNRLEMVFSLRDPADDNRKHIFYASRASTESPFSTPLKLAFNLDGTQDEGARFSVDDLTLYFGSTRAAGPNDTAGDVDVYQVSRPTIGGAWGTPTLVAAVNTAGRDKWYTPCGNQYVMSRDEDLAQGTIGSGPTVLTALSSTAEDNGVYLTRDCLTLYFASKRSGAYKIYRAQRATDVDAWGTPTEVTDFAATGGGQSDPWMSPDQHTFVFMSDASGNTDLYLSTR